ncbi:ABC transporter substrate-binding protein [Ensifer sp. Root31]|uniref:ABC transporter substrate-binding protein n=1 Tax=Ensifer sp. Root31 TaxID=1736512 RepID=UPI000710EE76|nr:ABC transporter substrate-binding protein [Ensifer sp. Root31]KQU86344.1 ABC transporter substrate-binding protein [Ensifer sp. Root31]
MISRRKLLVAGGTILAVVGLDHARGVDGARAQAQDNVLRIVPQSGLRIIDPVITTATVTRNHGYMVYDTLFAVDANFNVQPQMVDAYEVSDDKLTYRFKLRDGLKFHDGSDVAAEDVIASLRRWSSVDSMGMKLFSFVSELESVDSLTFTMTLTQPYALVLETLGKPGGPVPFIMPERIAKAPSNESIKEVIGSGPFRFVSNEFQPGLKVVYERNPDYRPRAEPASGLAGGKIAMADRVEWINIPDPQTAMNALTAGEVDIWEWPTFDLLPSLKDNPDIAIKDLNPPGANLYLRMNWLQPPFDNVKVRQVLRHAVKQQDYLDAQIGIDEYGKICRSVYGCNVPLSTEIAAVGGEDVSIDKLKQMLAESGYNGEKIVILAPTDVASVAQLPFVTADLLTRIGFNVDLQSMDWQTLVSRRGNSGPITQGGWHIFHSGSVTTDLMNPIVNTWLVGLGKQGGSVGWPEDPQIEQMRDEYARETDIDRQKELADAIQSRALETAMLIPLGTYNLPTAFRNNISGALPSVGLMGWNLQKN